jgi:hypothetical protein
MPAPRFTRRLPATAILGVGLVLGTAAPAVAEPAPVAKVIARGEREAVAQPAPAEREPLLLLVTLTGLVIGAGATRISRLTRSTVRAKSTPPANALVPPSTTTGTVAGASAATTRKAQSPSGAQHRAWASGSPV